MGALNFMFTSCIKKMIEAEIVFLHEISASNNLISNSNQRTTTLDQVVGSPERSPRKKRHDKISNHKIEDNAR